jgi:hypothetical protein
VAQATCTAETATPTSPDPEFNSGPVTPSGSAWKSADYPEMLREMVRAGADDVPADRLQVHRAYRRPTAPPQSTTGQHLVSANPLILLVPEKGVEPSTFSLRMSCSTN